MNQSVKEAFDFGYTVLMLLSILVGLGLSFYISRSELSSRLSGWKRLAVAIGALIGASLGAKVPFFFFGSDGMTNPFFLPEGKTIMLGLVGGYAGVELVKWLLRIRVKTGDGFAVPVAAAVAIGRLACFHGGCCYGVHTTLPWGRRFPTSGDGLARHPTQLYESAFHLAAAVILFVCLKKSWFSGQLIKLYILSYFAYRFLTEFIRPEPEIWLGLTFYQWAAMVMFPVFVSLWVFDAKRFRESGLPQVSETPLHS